MPRAPMTGAEAFADLLPRAGHELRSPLTAIVGLAKMMMVALKAGAADPDRQLWQLEMLQASAQRSLATVERVIEVAKLEAGRFACCHRAVDCLGIVDRVTAALRSTADRHGVVLRTEQPEYPITVLADPKVLELLLLELVGNGLRFTDAANLTVRVGGEDGRTAVIEVCDDGPGIPDEEQARIFEPFERGRRSVELDDEGIGMGLYLAQRQAALLGARLSVRSQAGGATTFSLRFPPRVLPGHVAAMPSAG